MSSGQGAALETDVLYARARSLCWNLSELQRKKWGMNNKWLEAAALIDLIDHHKNTKPPSHETEFSLDELPHDPARHAYNPPPVGQPGNGPSSPLANHNPADISPRAPVFWSTGSEGLRTRTCSCFNMLLQLVRKIV